MKLIGLLYSGIAGLTLLFLIFSPSNLPALLVFFFSSLFTHILLDKKQKEHAAAIATQVSARHGIKNVEHLESLQNEAPETFFGMVRSSDFENEKQQWEKKRTLLEEQVKNLQNKLHDIQKKVKEEEEKQPDLNNNNSIYAFEILRKGIIYNSWSKRFWTIKATALLGYKDERVTHLDDAIVLHSPLFERTQYDKKKFCARLTNSKTEYVFAFTDEKQQKEFCDIFEKVVQNCQKGKQIVAIDYPKAWEEPFTSFRLVHLSDKSQEFKDLEKSVKNSTKMKLKVVSLKRIQNPELWNRFQFAKNNLVKKHQRNEHCVVQKTLFHGTASTIIDTIIIQGFDHRVSNFGGLFGAGIYFADDLQKSSQYIKGSSKTSQVLVCEVLLGSSVVLKSYDSSLRRPPKMPSSNDLYDSVTGDCSSFLEYIIYNSEQAYPAYILEYSV